MRQIRFSFLGVVIATLFFGFMLYTLRKRRTAFILSHEYERVVEKTSYMTYQWSTTMWALVILVLSAVLLVSGYTLWAS